MQDIYLYPCEVWFGGGQTRVRTVLGSCVAVTLWHPTLGIGGMCHFMMPRSPVSRSKERDGCYADKAMALLRAKIRTTGRPPEEFEAKLFGAGSMFCNPCGAAECIPRQLQDRNIISGRKLVMDFGHRVVAEHLGGHGHRQLVFDIATGLAWLKHTPPPDWDRCGRCPKARAA